MTSTARASHADRPPNSLLRGLGPNSKISSWHHERLAVVYVRQSTAQQVLIHAEATRVQYGFVGRAETQGRGRVRVAGLGHGLGQPGTTAVGGGGVWRVVGRGGAGTGGAR